MADIQIYKHQGDGYYLGSFVIVLARDKKQACEMIRGQLDVMGLKDEELDVQRVADATSQPLVLYADNGDY